MGGDIAGGYRVTIDTSHLPNNQILTWQLEVHI